MQTPQKISQAESIAAEIMDSLGIENQYKGIVLRWIFRANILMGVPAALEKKQFEARIENCSVKKPCDFVKLVSSHIGGHHYSYRRGQERMVSEQTFYFDFHSRCNGHPFCATYLAYDFDELGYPRIDRTYFEALEAYVRYNWIKRSRTGGERRFYPSDEQQALRSFNAFFANARARKTMELLTQDIVDIIASKWNDPFYVNENPHTRLENDRNVAHAHPAGQPLTTLNGYYPGVGAVVDGVVINAGIGGIL